MFDDEILSLGIEVVSGMGRGMRPGNGNEKRKSIWTILHIGAPK
jgi:hypothetical protein